MTLKYFYEKRYRRTDGNVYVKRYSRSFPLGAREELSQPPEDRKPSNAQEASMSRARSTVRLLAFCNPQLTGLLTLTFRENVTDEDIAAKAFKAYRDEVRRLYPGWQYLGVKEYQKRGAIHYHLLVNFCPGQVHRPLWDNPHQQQSSLWEPGISDYRIIKGDDKWATELYLLKYLTKNKQRLFRHYYVRSRNLEKVEPTLLPYREPMHPLATNIFVENISINNVVNFQVMTYNYKYKGKTPKEIRRNAGLNGLSPYYRRRKDQ